MKYQIRMNLAALAAIALCGISPARADITTFVAPPFRGGVGTQSAYWDIFSSAYNGANSPNGIAPGGTTLANATITQTLDPTAFLTGGGNVYDFAASTGFRLDYSAGTSLGQVVFETRTLGSEIDYGAVALTYNNGTGPISLPATRIALPDALGGVTSEWTWDLSALGVNTFSIGFSAAAPSMSFDAATLDIAVVPEPSTFALCGLGVAGLVTIQARRRKAI